MFYGIWKGFGLRKGEVSLPLEFQEALLKSKQVLVTRGPGRHLCVYPASQAKQFDPSEIWLVDLNQGRIKIPRQLLASSLWKQDAVTWIGKGNYMQLRPQRKIQKAFAQLRELFSVFQQLRRRINGLKLPYAELTLSHALFIYRCFRIATVTNADKRFVQFKL